TLFTCVMSTTITRTLSLHDALPISKRRRKKDRAEAATITGTDWLKLDKPASHLGAEHRITKKLGVKHIAWTLDRFGVDVVIDGRSEEHTSELQSRFELVCRLLL